jgi:phosphorylase kinase alpha/beta subunit
MCDPALVSTKLKHEISHIRKHWLNDEAAVFTFMVTDEIAQSPTATHLYDTLKNLQLRRADRNVGYASAALAYRAARENVLHTPKFCLTPLQATTAQKIDSRGVDVEKILELAKEDQQASYELLLEKIASDAWPEDERRKNLNTLYNISQIKGYWLLTRLSFILLGRTHAALYEYLNTLSARHLTIHAGTSDQKEISLANYSSQEAISWALTELSSTEIETCLLQETFASIGTLQRTQPLLFGGLRTIHLHSLLRLCSSKSKSPWALDTALEIAQYEPSELLNKIERVLIEQHDIFKRGLSESISSSSLENIEGKDATDTDWFGWRAERGLIVNFDRDFLEAIWESLSHTKRLILGDAGSSECVIDCELVRSSMTSREEIFAQLIDGSIKQLRPPYYKSAMIETLLAYTRFCAKNEDVFFEQDLDLSALLELAARSFCKEQGHTSSSMRDIDILLNESPSVLQEWVMKAFEQTVG